MTLELLNNTPAELSLEQFEAVNESIRTNLEQTWNLLLLVHETKAYRLKYGTWEQYVTAEFGISRRHSNRLLNHARIVRELPEELRPIGPIPENRTRGKTAEQVARELSAPPAPAVAQVEAIEVKGVTLPEEDGLVSLEQNYIDAVADYVEMVARAAMVLSLDAKNASAAQKFEAAAGRFFNSFKHWVSAEQAGRIADAAEGCELAAAQMRE